MTPISRNSDDGFSLVEVIVALAMLSVIVMAIGGLIQFGSQLQSRSTHEARIELALIEALALGNYLGRWPASGDEAISPVASGFSLTAIEADVVVPRVKVAVDDAKVLTMQILDTGTVSSVNLAALENVEIEYLSTVAQNGWHVATSVGAESVDGVRLALSDADRQWWIVLWMKEARS